MRMSSGFQESIGRVFSLFAGGVIRMLVLDGDPASFTSVLVTFG